METLQEDLLKAQTGDREALGRLWEAQEDGFRGFVQKRLDVPLRDRVVTSDIMQSGFLQVLTGIAAFRGDTEVEFVAWVCRILENRIKQKRRHFGAKKRSPGQSAATRLRQQADNPRAPSAEVAQTEDMAILARALDALASDHREVILLRAAEGRSHREIAEALDRSEQAVRMLYSRARAALALEIERLEG